MLPPEIPRAGEPIRAEWMRRLIEWIKADVIPKGDGYTIQVNGNIISVIPKEEARDSYNGMFKLSLFSEEETGKDGTPSEKWYVEVIDGSDDESEFCGLCEAGQSRFWIDKTQMELPDENCDVWLRCVIRDNYPLGACIYCSSLMPERGAWPEQPEDAANPMDGVDDVIYILLGRVLYDPDTETRILTQEQHGPVRIDLQRYDGPFALSYDPVKKKIRVKAGYLRRNGKFDTVPETELEPQRGTICVTSELKNREWSNPEICFAEPDATHYPIGKCTALQNGGFWLDSFHVAVAVILSTGPCPLIKTG